MPGDIAAWAATEQAKERLPHNERLTQLGLPLPPAGPAILVYDIENAPALGWVWDVYQTNVIATEQDWYLLCFAWKWLGTRGTRFSSIKDDPTFQPDTTNDLWVTERLHALFNRADVVIAHNGDRFDQKKTNARFLYHRLGPASPYQSVDTLKESRRYFGDQSHKLAEIGRRHGLGDKAPTEGFALWRACMAGELKAWRRMERYNRQDVRLLESAYLLMRPFIGSPGKQAHPNLGHWDAKAKQEGRLVCPKCGHDRLRTLSGSDSHRTFVSEYNTVWCDLASGGCGGYSRLRVRERQHITGGVEAC
jgi:hypothetical protein